VTPAPVRRGVDVGGSLPLRVRLTVLLVLLAGVGLAVAGAASAAALRGYLVGRVDDQLLDEAGRQRIGPVGDGPGRGGGDRAPGQFYIAVLDADGRVLLTPSLTRRDDDAPDLGGALQVEPLTPTTVRSDAGPGQWRLVVRETAVRGVPGSAYVVYAADLGDVRGTTRRLVALELGVGLAVLALVAGAGFVLVRRSLGPLGEVEEAAAAVAAGDLSRRVPERDPRTEVGSLSRSFNEMVEQVQSAFATRAASEERLRQFAADASHELRTPLTSIRGFAELYRQGAVSDPDDVARVMARIEGESVRMGALVEDLLLLARMDQQRPLEQGVVDLGALAADAVHDAAAVADGHHVLLDLVPGGVPAVVGDEGKLRQVLANLVGNAVAYTPPGTTVTVRAGAAPGFGFLEVVDDGPGLAPEHAARVFERFYRADASRHRADGTGGSGLGLAIVKAIVEAHGGSVELVTAPGEGASFRVKLPLAP
jgi:two-component system, OmpR family, sensor kinase